MNNSLEQSYIVGTRKSRDDSRHSSKSIANDFEKKEICNDASGGRKFAVFSTLDFFTIFFPKSRRPKAKIATCANYAPQYAAQHDF